MITVYGKEVYTTLDEIVCPQHTALLVIDVQNDFFSKDGLFGRHGGDVEQLRSTLPNIRRVIDDARSSGVLTVFVQHVSLPRHLTESPAWIRFQTVRYGLPPEEHFQLKGSWGAEFVEEIKPNSEDIIVTKHRSSAFIGTDLDMILRSNSVKSVVIVGDVTQGCVESTARDAAFFDYYSVVLSDAVASLDQRLHEASLLVMASRVDVTTSETVLNIWQKSGAVGDRVAM